MSWVEAGKETRAAMLSAVAVLRAEVVVGCSSSAAQRDSMTSEKAEME